MVSSRVRGCWYLRCIHHSNHLACEYCGRTDQQVIDAYVIIYSTQADYRFGGAGDDLLPGGTAFDANNAALLALHREWASGRALPQEMLSWTTKR